MSDPRDIQRLIGDLVRVGTVASVDPAAGTCTVTIGDLTSGSIRWLHSRAGDARSFSAPSVGEQVVIACPEGDLAAGLVIGSLHSDANPAAGDRAQLHVQRYEDGSVVSYDAAAHHLDVQLSGSATATITAPGGLTIKGKVSIEGDLHLIGNAQIGGKVGADGDVVAAGVSLQNHFHDKTQPGVGVSGKPVPLA